AKGQVDRAAIRGQPQVGLRCFIATTVRMTAASGPLGPGLLLRLGENNSRYFRRTNARWKFNKVAGLSTMAARARRVGFTKREQNAAMNRSETFRLGARRRERFTMRS